MSDKLKIMQHVIIHPEIMEEDLDKDEQWNFFPYSNSKEYLSETYETEDT